MYDIIKKLTAIFSVILSFFFIGSPKGFQPEVRETVTTQTTQITVEALNKTGVRVTNPRVESIEMLDGDQWVEIGAYDSFTEPYVIFRPLGKFRETVRFAHIGASETLPEGEYRVVVTFEIRPSVNDEVNQTAYAYFHDESADVSEGTKS